jgi:hypothetical protein
VGFLYVARSARLGKWAWEVGLSKNVFKVGYAEDKPEAAIAAGWAGETDWKLVKKQPADGLTEDQVIARIAAKERLIDPKLYPKLKGAMGIFKVSTTNAENHILIRESLANRLVPSDFKLTPTDIADYLIHAVIG